MISQHSKFLAYPQQVIKSIIANRKLLEAKGIEVPSNQDLERVVLSCILHNEEDQYFLQSLNIEDFYSREYFLAFLYMQELYARGIKVDPNLLRYKVDASLKISGLPNNYYDNFIYIYSELAQKKYRSTNVDQYIKILKSFTDLRNILIVNLKNIDLLTAKL